MREAILNRISRRKYAPAPIPAADIAALRAELDRLNAVSGLSMAFVEDASDAFSSMLKTYGMFSGVRSVFVMKGPKDDPLLAEKTGYYGEELVLFATDLGLGTCWVAGTFDRKRFTIPEDEAMLCVIPVGPVAESQSGREKLIRNRISRKRKCARDRMTGYDDAPQWAKDAMEAVRLAPSAVNSQRPMFRWKDGCVTADVAGYVSSGPTAMFTIDLGIAKRHFAIEAGGTFAMGQGGAFTKKE